MSRTSIALFANEASTPEVRDDLDLVTIPAGGVTIYIHGTTAERHALIAAWAEAEGLTVTGPCPVHEVGDKACGETTRCPPVVIPCSNCGEPIERDATGWTHAHGVVNCATVAEGVAEPDTDLADALAS